MLICLSSERKNSTKNRQKLFGDNLKVFDSLKTNSSAFFPKKILHSLLIIHNKYLGYENLSPFKILSYDWKWWLFSCLQKFVQVCIAMKVCRELNELEILKSQENLFYE